MTMIDLRALQSLRLLLLLCPFSIIYLYSGHAMQIGERLTYKYTNKNFGTFDTAYQYFPATQKSSGLFAPKSNKPAVLCIHGFGGNACQFRKQSPVLAQNAYDTYAIDLLGYGYSDKPNPRQYEVNSLYNFDNWADQTLQFIRDVVRKPTVLVCNSIGGVVGLQTALQASSVLNRNNLIKEVVLIDVSLRLLHVKKQNALQRAVVPVVQQVLRETPLGPFFFSQVATPQALKNILNSAYAFPGKAARGVDDEIVDIILRPGLDPGAVNVFLDFISYRYAIKPLNLY